MSRAANVVHDGDGWIGRYGLGLGARGGTGAAGSWGEVERAGIILRAADGRQLATIGGVCVLQCGEEGCK